MIESLRSVTSFFFGLCFPTVVCCNLVELFFIIINRSFTASMIVGFFSSRVEMLDLCFDFLDQISVYFKFLGQILVCFNFLDPIKKRIDFFDSIQI